MSAGGNEGKRGPRKSVRVMRFLYSVPMNLVVYPAIALWTLLGAIAFPFLFLAWKAFTSLDNARIMRLFIWVYGRGWGAIMWPFVRFRKEGFDKTEVGEAHVMVMNHLSFFDFYCMGLLPFKNMAAAVRSWPFRMPWYAPFMRLAGYLDVESLGPAGSLAAGAETISRGGSVLFFPEGHRSRDGKLQRFFSGAFRLSVETGAKVLPICLTGTDIIMPHGRWWMMPARVNITVLPPIDPRAFEGPFAHIELRKYTKAAMAKAVAAMRQQ